MLQKRKLAFFLITIGALGILLSIYYWSSVNNNSQISKRSKAQAATFEHTDIDTLLRKAGLLITNNIDSSNAIYHQALEKSTQVDYNYGIAHSLIGISILHIEAGEHEVANQQLNKAYPFCLQSELKKNYILGVWYDNKGTNAKNLSQNDSATYYYEKALGYAEQLQNKILLATIHINLGSLFSEGHHDSYKYSIDHLEKALAICNTHNYKVKLPIIYSNIATIYEKIKNDSLFLLNSEKAIAASIVSNDKRVHRLTLGILGDYYLNKKELDTAIEKFQEGLLYQDSIMPFSKFSFYHGLAAAYFEKNNYNEALAYGNKSLELLKHTERNTQNTNNLYTLLAQINAQKGDYNKAYQLASIYAEKSDTLAKNERNKAIEHFNVRYETSLKDAALENQKIQLVQKNKWILSIILLSVLAIIVLTLLYLVSKNKQKLKTIALNDLKQQHKIAYLTAQMQGEIKERQRISRELHDGVSSILAAAKMKLSNVHNTTLSSFAMSEIYQNGLQLVHDAYEEVRQTAHNLSTERMIAKGLIESLHSYCEQINMPSKMSVHFEHFGTVPNLDGLFILDVYRVVQELLHNITKYAEATNVTIQTIGDDNTFSISIEDNGNGKDIDQIESNGLGWQNLKTRIKAWGGTLELDSRVDIGNTVYLNFKLPILKPIQEAIL